MQAPHRDIRTLEVDAANVGRRLDKVVRQSCPDVPLAALMRLIRCGHVRLNGRRARNDVRLAAGDRLSLPAPAGPCEDLRPATATPHLQVPILFEDDALLVVEKPAGMPCHAGTLHARDGLMHQVCAYLGASGRQVGHRPGLAQRLDLGVSGLLVVGKHAAVLRDLGQQVERHQLQKVYTALVAGRVPRPAGIIDAPLHVGDEPRGDRPRTVVDPRGKPAHTAYQVAARLPGLTLLRLRLRSGRTHQIRAHLRHLGHRLVGDPRYGDAALNAHMWQTYGIRWPCLHAGELRLLHPTTQEPLVFSVALPAWARGVSGQTSMVQAAATQP